MSEKLILKRIIKAKRQRVFEAWTNPELMKRWLAPGSMFVGSATVDLRVGGSYLIEMSGGNEIGKCVGRAVGGTYKRIIPNQMISFTWGWPGNTTPETLVTVEFRDVENGTEVILTHEGFSNNDDCDKHREGWLGCLEKLRDFGQEFSPNSRAADAAEDYSKQITIHASRDLVFDAIAGVEGIRAWWTPLVSGTATVGTELRLEFEGLDEYILLQIDKVSPPSFLQWTCLKHSDLPEWDGTKIAFDLQALSKEICELRFRHAGLTPKLTCYGHCKIGWDHFLASVVSYVERGIGMPFSGPKAWHENVQGHFVSSPVLPSWLDN